MGERCGAENPYGTGVCSWPSGHITIEDNDGARWDHYDGELKIWWLGVLKDSTDTRSLDPYAGWYPLAEAGDLLASLVRCPRCKALVLAGADQLTHQNHHERND